MMKGSGFSNGVVKLVLSFTMALILGLPGVSALGADQADRRLVINIPSRTLWVYEKDKIVRWFPVGVGRPGFPTPTGQYKVLRKIVNPVWEHPYKASGAVRIGVGPNNPLGTRWVGFKEYKGGEYGIHGTDNPSSVGKFSSHGCVRMKIKDAEALFDMVEVGTPVEVAYQTVLVRPQDKQMRLVVYPDAFGRGMPKVEDVRKMVLEQYPNAELDNVLIGQALARPTQTPFVVGRLLSAAEMAGQERKGERALQPLMEQSGPARQSGQTQQARENQKLNNASHQVTSGTRATAWEAKPQGDPIPAPKDIVTFQSAPVRMTPVPPSPMGQLEAAVQRDFSGTNMAAGE